MHSNPDQRGVLVNEDVLDTVLLSLHPKSELEGLTLSKYTREGLAEMKQFSHILYMVKDKGYNGRSVTLIS